MNNRLLRDTPTIVRQAGMIFRNVFIGTLVFTLVAGLLVYYHYTSDSVAVVVASLAALIAMLPGYYILFKSELKTLVIFKTLESYGEKQIPTGSASQILRKISIQDVTDQRQRIDSSTAFASENREAIIKLISSMDEQLFEIESRQKLLPAYRAEALRQKAEGQDDPSTVDRIDHALALIDELEQEMSDFYVNTLKGRREAENLLREVDISLEIGEVLRNANSGIQHTIEWTGEIEKLSERFNRQRTSMSINTLDTKLSAAL